MTTDWITPEGKARLARWGIKERASLNVLSVAFRIACFTVEEARLVATNLEVGSTASLPSVIWSFARDCANEFGSNGSPGCEWVQYRNKRSTVTEALTGADFAIVILLPEDKARIAIFQAKLPKAKYPKVLDVHRMSPAIAAKGWPREPQFTRLVRFGLEVFRKSHPLSTPRLANLTWIHYLHYRPAICNAYSVNQMQIIQERYEQRTPAEMNRSNSINLDQMTAKRLAHLLTSGAEIPIGRSLKSWLEVSRSVADAAILSMATTMTVFVGRDRSTAPGQPLLNQADLDREEIAVTAALSREDAVEATPPPANELNGTRKKRKLDRS